MLKGRYFWLALAVLLVVFWGGYRFYAERNAVVPGEEQQKVTKEGEELDANSTKEETSGAEMELHYLGHAAFLLQVGETKFLMDPYDPNCGYGELEVDADYITVSHEHMDHNYIAAAPAAKHIRGLSADGLGWEEISLTLSGVDVFTVPSYHDDAAGKLRGRNAIFVFDTGEIRLVHLGDLGHRLNPEQLEKLAPLDVLLIPVGGHFTIDGAEAKDIVVALKPAVVIPMHYRTEATRNWPIAPLEEFLKELSGAQERKSSNIVIKQDALPQEMEIWIMEAAAAEG